MTIINDQTQMSGHDRAMGPARIAACRVQVTEIDPAGVCPNPPKRQYLCGAPLDRPALFSNCCEVSLDPAQHRRLVCASPGVSRRAGRRVEHFDAPRRFRFNHVSQVASYAVQASRYLFPTHCRHSVAAGFNDQRQPREAEHDVPRNRAFGAPDDR